jgi:hypothetical protein
MNAAIAIDPNAIPSQRVATLITQRRAKMLMDHIDDLFFD